MVLGPRYREFVQEIDKSLDGTFCKALVEFKLATTLRVALNSVPAYEQYGISASQEGDPFALVRELPFVSKTDIKSNVERFISRQLPRRLRLKTHTGGSTAEPMMFYLQRHVTRPKEYAFMEAFEQRVGFRSGEDIGLALRGRTVQGANKGEGRLWMFEPIRKHLILSTDHLIPENMPRYLAVIRHWQCTYIQAFPSAVLPLAKWLDENPAPDITERIRGILLYSENVPEYQMRLLKRVFSCPVLKHYGHSERVLMAGSMPNDDRYFIWPQYGYCELVDFAGNPITQPGVLGEIVGTSFDNLVMPFVRYRTGDLAILSDRPGHPALPGYPAFESIEGRLQEFLVTKDHRLISICTMGSAHFEDLVDVDAMQYEQSTPGNVVIKVVSKSSLSDGSRNRIVQAVAEKTQHGCAVEMQVVSNLSRTPHGKHQMLIQHLDLAAYGAHLSVPQSDQEP